MISVVSAHLWSTKTNLPSMACRETYSVGFTLMSAKLGWGTICGCSRPMATRQLKLHPSLSGSLSSSRPIFVGGQLFRYPVLWIVQKLLRSAVMRIQQVNARVWAWIYSHKWCPLKTNRREIIMSLNSNWLVQRKAPSTMRRHIRSKYCTLQ